ncbi:uncharacterized protein MONBRDRAFT_8010 [Monosiga brevicollis MX1]|uniref:SSD domain-containing protein n=1 Tax=Monosiga brevicollis TaxID=81824 RepID=A9UYS1_MONBE|nr:uncharacterized protein MONBRDRAFT_8010 [Monosiga brevicollis MX1]EDQ89653.1 predicted protein [Monosiga brevicollis MX1]|eukprot:XP_001745682.1 hypothetical protein [Monosiga brevicollis MX1]
MRGPPAPNSNNNSGVMDPLVGPAGRLPPGVGAGPRRVVFNMDLQSEPQPLPNRPATSETSSKPVEGKDAPDTTRISAYPRFLAAKPRLGYGQFRLQSPPSPSYRPVLSSHDAVPSYSINGVLHMLMLIRTMSPVRAGLAVFGHVVGILVILGVILDTHSDIFPESGRRSRWNYQVRGAPEHIYSAYDTSKSLANHDFSFLETKVPEQPRGSVPTGEFEVILKSDTNCLSAENLRHQQALEYYLLNHSEYRTSFCRRSQSDGACDAARGVLRLFDGTYAYLNVTQNGRNVYEVDENFLNIDEVLSITYEANGASDLTALQNAGQPYLRDILDYAVGAETLLLKPRNHVLLDYVGGVAQSTVCRFAVLLGGPLPGYRSASDRPEEQRTQMGQWLRASFDDYLNDKQMGDMTVLYANDALTAEVLKADYDDVLEWQFLPLVLVFGICLVGTRSLFMAFNAVVSTVGATAWAIFLYRYVCDFHLFGVPQLMALPLAALLTTTSTLIAAAAVRRLLSRDLELELCLRAIANAVVQHCLVIGAATMLSFFFLTTSPLLEVQAFCLLCGWLAFTTTISAVLFLPLACCTWVVLFHARKPPAGEAQLMPCLSKAYFRRCVGHAGLRWFFLAALTVLVVVFLIVAIGTIEFDRKQPKLLRQTTPLQEFREQAQNFVTTNTTAETMLVFGVRLHDRKCHATDTTCEESLDFETSWDLNFDTLQAAVQAVCVSLANVDETTERALRLGRSDQIDTATNSGALLIDCPTTALAELLAEHGMSFPLETSDAINLQTLYPNVTPEESLPNSYYRFFEYGLLTALVQNATFADGAHFARFSHLVHGEADSTAQVVEGVLNSSGLYGDRVQALRVRVGLDINYEDVDVANGKAALRAWDEWTASLQAQLPTAATTLFHAGGDDRTWQWLYIKDTIETEMIRNFIVAGVVFTVVFGLLLGNWALALIGLIVTAMVVILVIGTFGFADWTLDLNSVVGCTVMVPLCLDLLSRFLFVYDKSAADSRVGRLETALSGAAEPLLFSAYRNPCLDISPYVSAASSRHQLILASILCVGALLPMRATGCIGGMVFFTFVYMMEDYFVYTFGTMMIALCGFTAVFGLIFLPSYLDVFGPQYEEGTIKKLRRSRDSINSAGSNLLTVQTGPSGSSMTESVETVVE